MSPKWNFDLRRLSSIRRIVARTQLLDQFASMEGSYDPATGQRGTPTKDIFVLGLVTRDWNRVEHHELKKDYRNVKLVKCNMDGFETLGGLLCDLLDPAALYAGIFGSKQSYLFEYTEHLKKFAKHAEKFAEQYYGRATPQVFN